jgi:hypothetical protein
LVHDPGVEAEVDWGQAIVIVRGVPRSSCGAASATVQMILS